MRIILLIVFYIATYVARIAIGGDIAKTMPGSIRYIFKSGTAQRELTSKRPVDEGIIQMINKRDRRSLLENRIDGFPQSGRNDNFKRVKRSLRKRKKRATNSDCKIARRRSNCMSDDDDIDEQSTSSNVVKFPIWQVPESTVPAINLDSATNPTIVGKTGKNTQSSLAFEGPPSQTKRFEKLDYDRSVNEAIPPIAERYPNSRGLLDMKVSNNKGLIPSKIAIPKSEIKIDAQSPAFEGPENKMALPRPGILADAEYSPNSGRPRGFQRQYDVRRNSLNNVKEEFDDRLTGSKKRFLLVPVSKNLYVLKNVREDPRTGGIIVPKRYKLLERDKDNATSAVLSFKAHMHHDVKDVGRAYLRRGGQRLFDYNYLRPTLEPRIPQETTGNSASYPDFLYPGVAFQTRPNSIGANPEISDEQIISPVPDCVNISFMDINLRNGINSYDSSALLSPSSTPNYGMSKGNDDQPSILSVTKLDDKLSRFQQDTGNYGNSFEFSSMELTTLAFRDTFDTLDNIYTPATLTDTYLTDDKEVFDVSQNLGDSFNFFTGRYKDEFVTDSIDNISPQYRDAFGASASEDNTFFPNITYSFIDNAEDVLNSEDIDRDSQAYGISIPDEYNNKKSIYYNDFDYNNRSVDQALLSNNITDMDLFLNAEDYMTAASLLPDTDEWPLKKAQSNVENSRGNLLMAIKPLSSELEKLLSAVKLVNRSLSDVQSRLCDKKNVVSAERGSEDRKVMNVAKLTNEVDRYDSDFFTESFNNDLSDKKRIKTKDGRIAERDVKIGRKTDDLVLNKLTTSFHKRRSPISNSKVQSVRRNFLKKRKSNEREFSKSSDVERRRLPQSRFNRNLNSLRKNSAMRLKPIRQFTETGLKRVKRTTTQVTRSSRFVKNNVMSNFAGGRGQNHEANNQMSRSTISTNKDNSTHYSSDQQDLQRNVKRAMSSEISGFEKKKKFSPIDPQFYKQATSYLDILRLLSKTEKPHVEYGWITQNLTESLPPLIFTTTEFAVSALTFFPYFTKESTITTTMAGEIEAPEMIESSLYSTHPIKVEILTTEIIEKMTVISPVAVEVTETSVIIPTIENFTTESVILLTPFLEGMTDVTLKITIPVAKTSVEETPALIEIETVTAEEETVEGTLTTSMTEIMESLLIETDTSLYTFSTLSLFKTVEELSIETTSPIVPVSTTLAITKGFQTTSESTFDKTLYNTTTITSTPTVIEETETILSTSTKVAITTVIPEDESPVTQIEKTITAEETATETPTTIETATPTEITITETPTTATKISTSVEIEFLTINKTLTTAETSTSIETSTTSGVLVTTSTISTTIEAITIILTPTEILTTLKIPITKGTTSVKTLKPTEILTSIETKTTPLKLITESSTITEISTSIETTTISEISTINKTLTTAETPTSIETPTASETPTTNTTTSAISTTMKATTMETVTPTKILTTLKTPATKGTTSAKTLTPTENLTSIETSTTSKISIISTIPTTIRTTIMETSTPTEILETTKLPTTKIITSTKAVTPTIIETLSTAETQMITETPTFTESLGTTEITVISTTYVTTKLITTSESATSSVLTTFPTVFTTESAESTLISSTPSITTISVKTTVPTLKLTTPLQTLITNATLSETPYTTISSTFFITTERSIVTSFKTAASTASLKVTMTTPLSSIATISSETPSTALSTFLIEEATVSSIFTTSSLETLQTTTALPIFTTVSTVEIFSTTSSIAIYTTGNTTVSSTTASTITAELFESTISPVVYFTATTPSITKILVTTPMMTTGTTAYEITSTLVTSLYFSTETIESTTSSVIEYEETEEYESTKEEITTVTSAAELTTEEHMTWVTEEITIEREITLTYLPSFTTSFFVGTITEVTPLAIETITLPTIAKETLLIGEIITVTPATTIEEISTFSEITLISTETSTMSIMETSSSVLTVAATTVSLPEKTSTEITGISWTTSSLPTTERPEYATILEAVITVTLAPFSESFLSILITSETPTTTQEVIPVLPKTISEEFTISTTESPLVTYATESSTISFVETTAHPAISISTVITEEIEAETEYYVAKEPFYEEEYEEYEEYGTEIPTGKWYYYEEYETTTKRRMTTETIKYTKLPKESPPFVKTTTLYEIETSELTRYSTSSEITSTYANVTSTAATSETSYAEEEVTSSALETSLSTIKNVTMTVAKTEFTMPAASEKTESTTFGSTEEYTLPSSTTFKIPTEPLEYLTVSPKGLGRFTQISPNVTLPQFITKPKEIPKIVLEKTTVSERLSTETETVEKLTSFFVSSVLTTLSEKEVFEVHTMSTGFSETEGTIETGYKAVTLAMTEEETILHVTPFITTEAEIELTTSQTIEREEQKEQLLRRLEDLKQHEKEMAEREERLKEKEKQWNIEKEKRRKMMWYEKEKTKNTTIVTTEGYVTRTTVTTLIASPVETVSAKNLTISTVSTAEIEITSPGLEAFITTSSLVETITVPTETIPFSTEEITSVTYTTEKMEKATTEESTFTIYTTEETILPYTIEKSTYITEEMEEVYITDYVTLTPYITTPIMDLYNIGLASIETVTSVEEMYATSYVTLYSEPFPSPTITSPITSTTEKFIILPVATFSERFEDTSAASITTPTWYTEEMYTATYTDIYGKPSFTSPTLELTLEFTSTTTSSTMAIITALEIKYDEEIERLKEELRNKERELEEREKILLEREERLERDVMEFEKYMKEFEKEKTSVISTVLTSLSTPVPPTEKTAIKAQLTTQIGRVTEKKENRTTMKMVTSQQTEIKDMEEKIRTEYVPEEAVTKKEEEMVTKQICLNVLENTTIPLDKRRRDIVTKKICLPHFPERSERKKPVGRISRRLLALQSTREIRRPRWNVSLDFRCRRRVKETTRKIDNLQLSHHEWLSNETTKPLPHFKGFTRIYRKMRKFPKKATIIDIRNATSNFRDKTLLYEQDILDHEDVFRPTATSMLDSKQHRKRSDFFRYDLISARKDNFPNKANIRKRGISPIENNARFSWKNTANTSSQEAPTATAKEDGFYTVNVLQLSYNEDKQTHEVISAKPDEAELTAILSESNDGNHYVTEYEDRKITTSYYDMEEEDNLKEDDDELADKTEKKVEKDEDYIEDMIDDYMNYEEHETSTRDRKFLDDRGKDKGMTENERVLLDQAWPTEKSTTYHLGGTKFWELDFGVTEPSTVLHTTTDRSKTTDVPITRTTCFDVVLKNEKNGGAKSNASYHKRDASGTRKDVFIEKRNASLKNVTKKNALRCELRAKRLRRLKLKRGSQKPQGLNCSERSFEEKRSVRFNDFRRTSDEASMTARSRKLCGVNASKLKRQMAKHKDTAGKHKKKQPAESRALRNVNLHSLHSADNCVVSKGNENHKTTMNPEIKRSDGKKNDEKVTRLNVTDHKNKSTPAPHEGRKKNNCFNCICDIANVVNDIRSLLDRMSFPLDEIKALNCSEYKEIQDKIAISRDSDMEEAREFPQPRYNIESLKGQKYIRLEELEDNFKSDLEFSDHDVISLPGLNLNLPCNRDGDGITWLSSVSRPSYTWRRTDGVAPFGFVAENGDLELRNVNAKDTGNYTCVMSYTSPDSEEPVETAYEIHLQVVTLPRYIVHGESRYHVRSCDERDLDVLVTYLPLKVNDVLCDADVCNAYVLAPSCSRNQITVNILLVPSHVVKLMTIDPKRCNVFCLKAIQDKLSLMLSKNLQIFLEKTIIFRLPHYEERLVPIVEKSSFSRRKRGKADANVGRSSNVGLFSSCPAGYGLRDTRCVPCNMGTYSEDGISHCKRCPPGTYQPNHGARVCRTCTNPMTKGCYNMLWNSFSAVMVTLASVGAMLSICFLLLWIICCAKKKFCVKRIAGIAAKENVFESEKRVEEQPLIKDASENEEQWDSEYRVKRKKGKFYINKKRRKQNERKTKYNKTQAHEEEWGSHRIKNNPIICLDSYQSHEDYNNYYPKSYRKGPRLPECDFDT